MAGVPHALEHRVPPAAQGYAEQIVPLVEPRRQVPYNRCRHGGCSMRLHVCGNQFRPRFDVIVEEEQQIA